MPQSITKLTVVMADLAGEEEGEAISKRYVAICKLCVQTPRDLCVAVALCLITCNVACHI